MNPDEKPMAICARKLGKRLGARLALEDFFFDLRHGEVLGYVGPNGAGNTTTLRILMGTKCHFSGEIEMPRMAMPSERYSLYAGMGYLPQDMVFSS
jgi:ABC-2 type transport system ATP-binding protein